MLIIENGTGLADADAYCSVAAADAYHKGRGNDAWQELSDYEKETALRRATDYLEQAYRHQWAGTRMTVTQALSWPRYMVPMNDAPGCRAWGGYYAQDVVPQIVANACAALALKASAGELAADIGRLKSRTKVGPIEVEYVAGSNGVIRYRAIDMMIAPLICGASGGMNIRVVRA